MLFGGQQESSPCTTRHIKVDLYNTNMDKFTTTSTSSHSEKVKEPVILEETSTTRRVFIADINDSKIEKGETVSGTIIHQRKNKKDEWESIESINLTSLKGGEGVKLRLKSDQTKRLYEGLTKLYAISNEGVQSGVNEFVVGRSDEILTIPKERKEFINQLIQEDFGEEVWEELIELNPDLATRLSYARIQSKRKLALNEFEKSLNENQDENYWQNFFKENQWIFGYGLQYKFLNVLSDQPSYGGQSFIGKGNQRGDFLLKSEAEVMFTVLVEIKKPTSKLLAVKLKSQTQVQYRNGAWLLGSDLLGGVSQLQTNCKTWLRKSLEPENNDKLFSEGIYTVSPKGILVIGHTKQLKEDRSKIETFELFRRNINNLEIITFDELFHRAKFIINHEFNGSQTIEVSEVDDLPF